MHVAQFEDGQILEQPLDLLQGFVANIAASTWRCAATLSIADGKAAEVADNCLRSKAYSLTYCTKGERKHSLIVVRQMHPLSHQACHCAGSAWVQHTEVSNGSMCPFPFRVCYKEPRWSGMHEQAGTRSSISRIEYSMTRGPADPRKVCVRARLSV